MSKVELNKKIPDVETHITGDKQVRLSGYLGKPLVLYFYPKASTPGCTPGRPRFQGGHCQVPPSVNRNSGSLTRQAEGTGEFQGEAGIPL